MSRPNALLALKTAALYLLLLIGAGVALYAMFTSLGLIPPKQLSMAAGSPGSAYYDIALKYQAILAEDEIDLRIVETAGSAENQDLMDDPESGVDIAIIQGGIASENPDLTALAAIFPEPLLVFSRQNRDESDPHQWAGQSIALGAPGSGTRAVVDQLAKLTEAPVLQQADENPSTAFGGQQAAEALINGDVSLAFFVAPLDAPYLQALYEQPDIRLMSLANHRALANQLPEARWVELHSGAIRYHPAYPEETTPLVAMVTKLVARDDLHPALVNRLVHAMVRIHKGYPALAMSQRFPNTKLLDMPADIYSSKLLKEGFSPLEAFMPYWIVAQFNRVLLLLLPIIFLLLPIFKILPAILAWRIQSRIYRYYDRLHDIDLELSDPTNGKPEGSRRDELLTELDQIEAGLRDESLPLKYRERAYIAAEHVQYVRQKL